MKQFIALLIFLSLINNLYSQTPKVKVKLHSIVGYGNNDVFAKEAATALEEVLNSEEFKSRVLSMTSIKNKDLTNQQLYDLIMKAHETVGQGGQDNVVDLRIRTLRIDGDESNWRDNCFRSTIGIDGTGDGVTAICPNKLESWVAENKINELAGHFAHEYMHILGFDHYNPLRGQKWREKTFVYKIGDLISELIEKKMIK